MDGREMPRRVKPALQWWTGGKETAWSRSVLQADPEWDIVALLTQVDRKSNRSVDQNVRRELIERQAAAMGLPLYVVEFDHLGVLRDYEVALERGFHRCRREMGVEFCAFGELWSGSHRAHRSAQLANTGLVAEFPLWGRDPWEQAEEMLDAGLSAWICAVDPLRIPADRAGRRYDREFLATLPAHVDPCGENGEFHTFVEWAPGWTERVPVKPVRRIERYGSAFVDLKSADGISLAVGSWSDEAEAGHGQADRFERVDPFAHFERLRRVRSYVDAHLVDELDLATVASVAAMRPSSFGRFFRQRVRMTFRQWLAQCRMERARVLLRESDASVSWVGRQVGFASDRTFRHVFRQRYGCSPSRYRKTCLLQG